MLLHTLPISPVVVRYPERPQPVQFSAIPRIPIWSWLGPVAAGEALTTIAVPACMLLHASSPQWLPFHVVAIAFGSLLIWFMAAQSQRLYRPLQGPYAFRLESLGTAGVLWLFGVSILLLAAEPRIAGRDATEALGAGLGLMFALRLFWRARLRARLRGGSCIDRALVMATDRATARAAADELEEAFGQCVRAAVCIPLPGSANAPSLAWIEDAICSHMVDQVYIVGCNNLDAAFTDVLPQLAGLDIDVVLSIRASGRWICTGMLFAYRQVVCIPTIVTCYGASPRLGQACDGLGYRVGGLPALRAGAGVASDNGQARQLRTSAVYPAARGASRPRLPCFQVSHHVYARSR